MINRVFPLPMFGFMIELGNVLLITLIALVLIDITHITARHKKFMKKLNDLRDELKVVEKSDDEDSFEGYVEFGGGRSE